MTFKPCNSYRPSGERCALPWDHAQRCWFASEHREDVLGPERDCESEFGLHGSDHSECAEMLYIMSGGGDDGSWEIEQYNRGLEEEYLGRPLFPNEY